MAGTGRIRFGALKKPRHLTEPAWVQSVLIVVTLSFLGLFLAVPLASVFVEALRQGWRVYVEAIREPVARA